MTQIQPNASLANHHHYQRQMHNGNDEFHMGDLTHMRSFQPKAPGRENGSSLGNLLRNNSLPEHGPTQDPFLPDLSRAGQQRRASAFPTRPSVGNGYEYQHPRVTPGSRANDTVSNGNMTMRGPWNQSVKGSRPPLDNGVTEGRNSLNPSSEPSPTENGDQSFRRDSAALWSNGISSNSSRNGPTLQPQRPSLSSQTHDTSSRKSYPDPFRSVNGHAAPNGTGFHPSSTASQDALSLISPTSSDGTRPTARNGKVQMAELERSLQQLKVAETYSQSKSSAGLQFDYRIQDHQSSRMMRNGSSPGQPKLSSGAEWNDGLASRWGMNPFQRQASFADQSSNFRPRGYEHDMSMIPTASGENPHSTSMFSMSSKSHRYGHQGEDHSLSHFGAGLNDVGDQFNARNGIPDFLTYGMSNGATVPGGYRSVNSCRSTANVGRDFIAQHSMFPVSSEMLSNQSLYYGSRYNQPWANTPFTIPPTPNIPYLAEQDPSKVYRSALMEEFRMSNKSGRRWELKDIHGHIVEFAGDQHGSRFLQDKLKTANSEEKDRVFQEILPNAVVLMKDVFGNYVLQKFFEHGDQSQKASLVSKMKGHVFALSTQTYACRVVQKALGHILVEQQVVLIQELDGRVMDCIKCENGNHVIQVAIEQVPLEHIPFMVSAIQADIPYLSMHKYGCRVIQRMLEHAKDDVLSWLVPELHKCSSMLIGDQFGNYVPAHIVEKGTPEDRNKIIDVVRGDLLRYSKQKFASHVVEKCIRFGTDQQRRELMQQLSSIGADGHNELEVLVRDGFANYVVQSLLETLPNDDYAYFCHLLQPALERARLPSPCKSAEQVARRMNRFDMLYQQHQQRYRGGPTWNNSVFVS